MRGPSPLVLALLGLSACGASSGDATGGGDPTAGPTATSATTDAPSTTATSTTGTTDPTTTATTASGTTGAPDTGGPEPAPACADVEGGTVQGASPPPDHGFATVPPTMALGSSFYTYDVRTKIGDCATDRVWWRLHEAPAGAALELGDQHLAPGGELEWNAGGDPREHATLAWDLESTPSGCHALELRWRAWIDCGLLDDGHWGPELRQRWELAVRDNRWYAGDLHVHTRHSERGDEAGGVMAYYRRMINAAPSDAGETFADRRRRSLRGRLHWLVFSDHTDRELAECGRHFHDFCVGGEPLDVATGRGVARMLTESDPTTLLVVGSEISNKFDGHFGFIPKNPFPGHPIYAPGYTDHAADFDRDFGFGPGVFPERWVDATSTNGQQIALAQEIGGLVIVNHENPPTIWMTYDWSSLAMDGLEVWNGGNRHDQSDDDAYHGKLDVNAIAEDNALGAELPEDPLERSYIGLLKTGRWPVALVGGSDTHDFNEIVCGDFPCDPTNAELASPTTAVWADRFVWADGARGVGDGLAAGRVVVHDRSNFIDLRVTHGDREHLVGDTIAGYQPGEPLDLRAFGRVADFIDGDNRVLLILGTSGDPDDRAVDVLYSSEDDAHFVQPIVGELHMRYIRPDSNFDRRRTVTLTAAQLGAAGTYFVWAQLIPWHNPIYLQGNGQDMALTGALRIQSAD